MLSQVVLSLVRAGVVALGGYLRAESKDLISFLQFSMGCFVQKFWTDCNFLFR
jgi:hypothetical protein